MQRKATAFGNTKHAYFPCIFAFTMVVSTVVDNRPCNDQQPRNTQVILMHLSLGQAAKETGMDKSTISRAIKSGNLSATRQENGGYAIDPAELFRVFASRLQGHGAT